MIILDTDVLSELMETRPNGRVVAWLNDQPEESTWTTAITLFEIQVGIELLAPGRKRLRLEEALDRTLDVHLQGRVLPFDQPAARAAAVHAARRRNLGRPVGFHDTEIAGIVVSRRATLATRNIRDFQDLGISLVNPWEPE